MVPKLNRALIGGVLPSAALPDRVWLDGRIIVFAGFDDRTDNVAESIFDLLPPRGIVHLDALLHALEMLGHGQCHFAYI